MRCKEVLHLGRAKELYRCETCWHTVHTCREYYLLHPQDETVHFFCKILHMGYVVLHLSGEGVFELGVRQPCSYYRITYRVPEGAPYVHMG